jgi:putative transposase
MTSKTVAALMSDLEVARSQPRPKVSIEVSYSKAWFKALKYAPTFPERFGCLADARGSLGDFAQWAALLRYVVCHRGEEDSDPGRRAGRD